MRHAKMLGLLTVAAAALMAFAATASATTGTDSAGGSLVEVGDTIHATNVGNTVLDGTINVTCKKSTVKDKTDGNHEATLEGTVETLTFEECGANTVTVVNKGTLAIHTFGASADGNGTLTSSGAEVTVQTHNILGTVHCIYVTSATDVGKLDGSNSTGGTATITVDSVPIPRKSTDFGCGSTSEWTAEYTVSTPDYLAID